jgi:MoxR-like ATPase
MDKDLITYGKTLNSEQIKTFLMHVFTRNDKLNREGKKGTPVMIWGMHGIGKTQLVAELAKEKGWKFAHFAPAQFEEMGDLLGMPVVVEGEQNEYGGKVTRYSPPEWVPKEEGPGILLIDDMNRADDRILRGLMQLLQNYELVSWKLPNFWQIVATANPEGGNYSVTSMDDALITRMMHVTMKFEPKVWAKWALESGIDERCVNFLLTYPELVQGGRTTPRSLSQFFEQIKDIPDLKKELVIVDALAKSTLDSAASNAFLAYLKDDLVFLLTPEEILDGDPEKIMKKFEELVIDSKGEKKIDRIATICTRLFLHLVANKYKVKKNHAENLVSFLISPLIPNDLRLSFYKDIRDQKNESVRTMVQDPRLANLISGSI